MYKIGEFSKITNMTVKALRYYDEENILKPSYRNEENGYRFYNDNDFKKAQLIGVLRELEFSISEVKDVISSCEDEDDLSYFLEEKKKIIEDRIRKERILLKKINLYTKPSGREEEVMDYKVEIKNFDPIKVAAIRFTGKYDEVGEYFKTIYSAVKGNSNGEPFNCYYDDDYKEIADIEVCVPVLKSVNHPDVTIKEMPAVKAVTVTYVGPYENFNMAYKAIFDYIEKNNLKWKLPTRVVYIKGPGIIFKGNPNKYVTEIIVPIE